MALGGQDCKGERQHKKHHRQIDRAFLQDVGGLSTDELGHGTVTKRGTKAFLARALHENDENQKEADENFDYRENANQNVHKGARIWGKTSFWQAASHSTS